MSIAINNHIVKVNSDLKLKTKEKYLTGIISERLKDLDPYANEGKRFD